MIKRFLQRWLGIQELSDAIALREAKPKTLADRNEILVANYPSDAQPEQSPVIIKGYDRPQHTDS